MKLPRSIFRKSRGLMRIIQRIITIYARSWYLSGTEIHGNFLLPEGADPAEYDLDAIKKQLKEEHGLQFGRLLIVG